MKYTIPNKGIGWRRTFNKRYKCCLINEFRTSILCNKCKNKMEHFKDNNNKEVHRLLVCSNCNNSNSESETKPIIRNRDRNAVLNIRNLALEWIESQTRNVNFTRVDDNYLDNQIKQNSSIGKSLILDIAQEPSNIMEGLLISAFTKLKT